MFTVNAHIKKTHNRKPRQLVTLIVALFGILLLSGTNVNIASAVDTDGQIDATNFSSQSGIKIVSNRDGGDDVVGYINTGDSTTYDLSLIHI